MFESFSSLRVAGTYLSVGHSDDSVPWVLDNDDIRYGKAGSEDNFHGIHFRAKVKGWVDKRARTISVIQNTYGEAQYAEYAIKLLRQDYPNYRIRVFDITGSRSWDVKETRNAMNVEDTHGSDSPARRKEFLKKWFPNYKPSDIDSNSSLRWRYFNWLDQHYPMKGSASELTKAVHDAYYSVKGSKYNLPRAEEWGRYYYDLRVALNKAVRRFKIAFDVKDIQRMHVLWDRNKLKTGIDQAEWLAALAVKKAGIDV